MLENLSAEVMAIFAIVLHTGLFTRGKLFLSPAA